MQARFDSWDEPTHWQLVDAALSCHHDYGLLPPEKQAALRFEAKQWLHAWRKVFMQPSYIQKQEQPTPAPLQLREGAWYRTEKGQVFGPLVPYTLFPSLDAWHVEANGEMLWRADGKAVESSLDLIAEVPPPVEQFKPGDLVVCVDGDCDAVTGTVYQVASIDSYDLVYVGVKRDGYFRRRFRRATPAEVAAHKQAQEPQPDADGWIEHDGNACPVDEALEVQCKLVNGAITRPRSAGDFRWSKTTFSGDITHYRLVPSPQPAPIITDWVEVVTR